MRKDHSVLKALKNYWFCFIQLSKNLKSNEHPFPFPVLHYFFNV